MANEKMADIKRVCEGVSSWCKEQEWRIDTKPCEREQLAVDLLPWASDKLAAI